MSEKACVACARSSAEVPLLEFEYQGRRLAICSQHLPTLIHDPSQLAGHLPGADEITPG